LGSHRLYLKQYEENISLGPTYLINPYFEIKLKVPLKKITNQKSKPRLKVLFKIKNWTTLVITLKVMTY